MHKFTIQNQILNAKEKPKYAQINKAIGLFHLQIHTHTHTYTHVYENAHYNCRELQASANQSFHLVSLWMEQILRHQIISHSTGFIALGLAKIYLFILKSKNVLLSRCKNQWHWWRRNVKTVQARPRGSVQNVTWWSVKIWVATPQNETVCRSNFICKDLNIRRRLIQKQHAATKC